MIEIQNQEGDRREVLKETTEDASTVFKIATMSQMVSEVVLSGIQPQCTSLDDKPFDVQSILSEFSSLRDEATKDYQTFYVGGRNATDKTLQKVYSLMYVVLHDGDNKHKVIDRMKASLPETKVRKTTREAAVFVRYVFADFDDKQVHVYSVALEVAFAKKVEPTGFITWVDGHTGRYSGIRVPNSGKWEWVGLVEQLNLRPLRLRIGMRMSLAEF
jgi:hypothetical protein